MTPEKSIENLQEFIRNNPPGPFKPLPLFNRRGNMLIWYFSDEEGYADPIYVDGVHIGSVIRSHKTKAATGVKINLESVKPPITG